VIGRLRTRSPTALAIDDRDDLDQVDGRVGISPIPRDERRRFRVAANEVAAFDFANGECLGDIVRFLRLNELYS
jgi:hypothetical protein